MHMLLLVGVSVVFALSVLTANNFYAEKAFTSSVNHVVCNEMESKSCQNLIAQASGSQGVQAGGPLSSYGKISSKEQSLWDRLWSSISKFFRRLF
jgi:hypothetical protein